MELTRPSHDELVKLLMTNKQLAIDFFKAHVPSAILRQVDLTSIRLELSSFVDENLAGHESDLVFRLMLKNQQQGFFFLLEHQSNADSLIAFRIRYYMMQLLKRHLAENLQQPLPLPIIYPIILYNGYKSYSSSQTLFELFGEYSQLMRQIWNEACPIIDVGQLSDGQIKNHGLAGLLELSLCRTLVREVKREMELFTELYRHYHGYIDSDMLSAVIKYLFYKWQQADDSNHSVEHYVQCVKELLSPELEKNMTSLAEAFIQKGKLEGKLEGQVETLNQTRYAIELLKKGTPIERITALTCLNEEMVVFLNENMQH